MAGRRTALAAVTVVALSVVTGVLVVTLQATSAIAATAKVWLTTSSGSTLPEPGTVAVGQPVIVHLSGFNANAKVIFQLGPTILPFDTVTSASGAGAVQFATPTIAPDGYLLTASTDQVTAVVALNVVPAGASTASPTAVAVATTSASPGTSESLAHSGAPATFQSSLVAAVLLAFGAALFRIGAPILRGRHERPLGRHLL